MAEKSYKVCDGGAWIYGKFCEGGSLVVLNERQAKYLLMDKTVTDPSTEAPKPKAKESAK